MQIKDGLSSNTVNAILKDKYGLMWFATEDGLNKFDGSSFTVYRYKLNDTNGLQSNDVRALYEDRTGNLWVGTSGGSLSLLDRKNDSFITLPANKDNALSSNVVRSICGDYKGKIWVATFNGVDEIAPTTRKVTNYLKQVNKKGAFPSLTFNYLYEDSKRRLWVASTNGLYYLDRTKRSFSLFRNQAADHLGLENQSINTIVEDKFGAVWVGTTRGLFVLPSGGKDFVRFENKLGGMAIPLNISIASLVVAPNDELWVGTDDGLYIMNLKNGQINRYKPNSRDIYSLTGKSIGCIYYDRDGIYWLGPFHGGVCKYDTNLNLFHLMKSNMLDKNGLNGSVVTSFEAYKGNIFVGTDGGGLNLFNRKTELFTRYSNKLPDGSALNSISIMAMELTKKQKLYIGTYSNGLVVMDLNNQHISQFKQGSSLGQLNSNDVFCLKEVSSGQIWLGTNGGGVNVLDEENKVLVKYCKNPKAVNEIDYPGNNFVRFIEQDNQGKIWVGSYGSGIAVFDDKRNTFSVLNKLNSKLPNDLATAVLKDSKGNMWVGTFSGGLSLYNSASKQFTTYAEEQGLNNASVWAIEEDKQGRIWVSTNKGISSFDRKTHKFTNYGTHNGVQNNNFVLGAGLSTADGEIYFGGADGFNYFDPKYFSKNKNLPPVIFTDLKISNTSVMPSDDGPISEHISVAKDIYLDYKQSFSLSFASLNYTAPEQNQYSYQLEGFDKDWIAAGTSKSVSYTNLDPGDYVFHVKASNNDGVWNGKETSIKIHVRPPFWRTIYAYILYFVIIAGTLLYIRHRGIEKLRKEFASVQEKMKADQARIQERQEAERFRELDQLKIKFLTNLSHEFRTPLSLILGPLDKLLSVERETEIKAPLQMIKRNTKRLLNLVNQILDFKKVEERELRLDIAETDIVAFVKDVLESFNDLSDRKQIQLVFKSQLRYLNVAFDLDKIERVLFNLLSNAFKFTSTGGTISIELETLEQSSEKGKSLIVIKVADTGIGIPQEIQSKVFDRFYQADGIAPVLNQGSGIGLSIAKEFVKLHGGDITVQSEPNVGSVFTIRLPFEKTDFAEEVTIDFSNDISAVQEVEELPASQLESTELPVILLVEDNEDFRFYLKDSLKSYYRVYEAANGQEGWQKALANHPQIIVSDINMPYMNGIEFSKKLKADKRTNHIPIILLTAITGQEEQIKGLETGANDYLTKPFNFEILNAKIKNLLDLNQKLRDTYTKQIKVQSPEIVIESHSDRLLNKVMLYIEENLNNSKLSVEDLSKHVGMSRGSLYHKILELTGLSPIEYIRSVKLEKAVALLEKSDLNVSQIAYMVGFATPNYFAKSFKAKYNMQPSEYINQKRKLDDYSSKNKLDSNE
ncbi:two-component regulator propeller domain-containing protein [Pedobacter sp.]|uniref:hybrid sensor histidine kinase/response regulator transcription factor n=1 Tax=Pedobacter sp. TaxID=1411316 RepID=UPI0031E321C2